MRRPVGRRALPGASALLVFLAAVASRGYVRSTVPSDGTALSWDLSGGSVEFRVNPAGSDDVSDGSDLAAIAAAFQGWQDVPTCRIAFRRGPDSVANSIAQDGVNPVFWTESSTVIDGADITNALAVTFNYYYTSGPAKGRIVDANLVFNGVQYTWTTDPGANPSAFDIHAIAAHEGGHFLGLDHSPVGAATMFPRTPPGAQCTRTLHPDDEIGCSVAYPEPSLAGFGSLGGFIRDLGGTPLFGVHVAIRDPDGNVRTGALSRPDGSYRIDGIPAGSWTVHAEPLGSGTPSLISPSNLGAWWGTARNDVRPSADALIAVPSAATASLDFALGAAPPVMRIAYIADSSLVFRNAPAQVVSGAIGARVGAAGPGLPSSGTPLSVSGTGLTVTGVQFGTVGGFPSIVLTVNVDAGAAPGARTLIVTRPGERVLATGYLEILPGNDRDGDRISDDDEGDGLLDTDGDGRTDDLDLDSDGDGLLDSLEGGDSLDSTPPWDTDSDGSPDSRDLDSDDDTIGDAEEGIADPDADEDPAFRDLESDGDGIPDEVEAGDADPATPAFRSDADPSADFLDPDADADTILDSTEAGPVPAAPRDSDADGFPDFRETDSDDDFIPDGVEAGDADPMTPPRDTDRDGAGDYRDADSDGDALGDAEEAGAQPWIPRDADGDGTADFRDSDSDEDGIPDALEAGDSDPVTPAADTDGDGIPDARDPDSDGDAILDAEEGDMAGGAARDTDGDGAPDFRDPDSDADSLPDAVEAGDSDAGTSPEDTDGDGTPDFRDADSDDDGAADGTGPETASDWDGDGRDNYRDPDSDNGGEPDGSEAGAGRDPLDPRDDLPARLPGPVPDGRTPGTDPLRLSRAGDTLRIAWDAAPEARDYRVFRGDLPALRSAGYTHLTGGGAGACSTGGGLVLEDSDDLGSTGSWYYLVAGFNPRGLGPLGDSDLDGDGGGEPIPAGPGCP